jgi:hypothetical protein
VIASPSAEQLAELDDPHVEPRSSAAGPVRVNVTSTRVASASAAPGCQVKATWCGGSHPVTVPQTVCQGLGDRRADAIAEDDADSVLGADLVRCQRPPLLDVRGEQVERPLRRRGDGDALADRFDRGQVGGHRILSPIRDAAAYRCRRGAGRRSA